MTKSSTTLIYESGVRHCKKQSDTPVILKYAISLSGKKKCFHSHSALTLSSALLSSHPLDGTVKSSLEVGKMGVDGLWSILKVTYWWRHWSGPGRLSPSNHWPVGGSSKTLTERFPNLRDELKAPVRNNVWGNTMKEEDVAGKEVLFREMVVPWCYLVREAGLWQRVTELAGDKITKQEADWRLYQKTHIVQVEMKARVAAFRVDNQKCLKRYGMWLTPRWQANQEVWIHWRTWEWNGSVTKRWLKDEVSTGRCPFRDVMARKSIMVSNTWKLGSRWGRTWIAERIMHNVLDTGLVFWMYARCLWPVKMINSCSTPSTHPYSSYASCTLSNSLFLTSQLYSAGNNQWGKYVQDWSFWSEADCWEIIYPTAVRKVHLHNEHNGLGWTRTGVEVKHVLISVKARSASWVQENGFNKLVSLVMDITTQL